MGTFSKLLGFWGDRDIWGLAIPGGVVVTPSVLKPGWRMWQCLAVPGAICEDPVVAPPRSGTFTRNIRTPAALLLVIDSADKHTKPGRIDAMCLLAVVKLASDASRLGERFQNAIQAPVLIASQIAIFVPADCKSWWKTSGLQGFGDFLRVFPLAGTNRNAESPCETFFLLCGQARFFLVVDKKSPWEGPFPAGPVVCPILVQECQ